MHKLHVDIYLQTNIRIFVNNRVPSEENEEFQNQASLGAETRRWRRWGGTGRGNPSHRTMGLGNVMSSWVVSGAVSRLKTVLFSVI